MLIGAGRSGTSNPHLGIPAAFSEINRASVLCEIVATHEHLAPDVSLGTHFFNELVENNMLYIALFPDQRGNLLRDEVPERASNALTQMVPSAASWELIIRVVKACDLSPSAQITIWADAMEQRVLCYFDS